MLMLQRPLAEMRSIYSIPTFASTHVQPSKDRRHQEFCRVLAVAAEAPTRSAVEHVHAVVEQQLASSSSSIFVIVVRLSSSLVEANTYVRSPSRS
jgi:hypothetical protein